MDPNKTPKETEVELDAPDTDEFEIEVVDDTPEEDRGRPRRPEGVEPELPSDDDLEQHSEGVRKRIQKLKYEYHEERRQREEAQRQKDEALEFAKRVKADADRLRDQLRRGDEALVTQAKERLKSQLEQAQSRLRAAHDAGDTEAIVQASTQIAELKAEESRISGRWPAQQVLPNQPQQQPQQPQQPQQRPEIREPSTAAKVWAAKNPWFGSDEVMTALAFGVHEQLIKQGVAPDSEAYYSQIDTAMRKRFPEKFGDEGPAPRRRPGLVVAPGGRSTAAAPRKVVLTRTQVAIAERLGLTLQQYAAQVAKEKQDG